MRRILTAVVAAAALAGCSSPSDAPKDRLTLERSTTTTTSAASAALAARLPTIVLHGFTLADDVTGSGPLDLEAAATASNDVAAERTSLETHGFVRGISRSWANPASDTVYVALYEFRDAAGAAGYAAAQAAALAAHGATPFPGGFTTVEREGTASLTTHAAIRQEGRWWVLALVASESGDRTPADATGIAATVRL